MRQAAGVDQAGAGGEIAADLERHDAAEAVHLAHRDVVLGWVGRRGVVDRPP